MAFATGTRNSMTLSRFSSGMVAVVSRRWRYREEVIDLQEAFAAAADRSRHPPAWPLRGPRVMAATLCQTFYWIYLPTMTTMTNVKIWLTWNSPHAFFQHEPESLAALCFSARARPASQRRR
jgi:hypothetical protein